MSVKESFKDEANHRNEQSAHAKQTTELFSTYSSFYNSPSTPQRSRDRLRHRQQMKRLH